MLDKLLSIATPLIHASINLNDNMIVIEGQNVMVVPFPLKDNIFIDPKFVSGEQQIIPKQVYIKAESDHGELIIGSVNKFRAWGKASWATIDLNFFHLINRRLVRDMINSNNLSVVIRVFRYEDKSFQIFDVLLI